MASRTVIVYPGSRRARRMAQRPSWPARVVGGLVALLVTLSTLALGAVVVGSATHTFRLAPVLSGSMSPTIPVGSLVLAEPVPSKDLRTGDVLLFQAPVSGRPLVMHRIFNITKVGGQRVIQTKGDANEAPDVWSLAIKSPEAWRVAHHVPHVGTAMGWLSYPGVRVAVLVLGAVLLLIWGLRAVWAKPPINWKVYDPKRVADERERRKARSRSMTVTLVGGVAVLVLAGSGLAFATFTDTPTPPAPGYGSGSLAAPSTLTCRWASATTLQLDWLNNSPGFTLGYDVLRSATSGSGYSSIATPSPDTTVTYTDTPAVVTTLGYYVVDAKHSPWSSSHSNEVVSNACIGAINLVAGTSNGFSGDNGQATAAQISNPTHAAVDSSGNVYIADTGNNRIRKVDASTGVITTIAGGGASTGCAFAGAATSATLNAPQGVAIDASGNLYIADTGNNCIRKVSSGNISLFAGTGATTACTYSGSPTGVSMSSPRGINVDSSGNLYIMDTTRRCVRKVSGGTMSQVVGAGTGTASACTFSGAATAVILSTTASDVAVDSSGNVYVADTGSACIRKVASGNVSQFAGGGASTACTFAGAATSVSLSGPTGVAVDSSGRVVISDNGRRCVRIVASGNVSQLAATGTSGSTGDNGPAIAARLTTPTGVSANASGDIWIADTGTDRIRRVEGPT